jgi:hypothetical protein
MRNVSQQQSSAESADADDSSPLTEPGWRLRLAAYCKLLFVFPLALVLLFLAFLFVVFKGDQRRRSGCSMSYQWPRVSSFKTYAQRLLRELWRNPHSKRYAR